MERPKIPLSTPTYEDDNGPLAWQSDALCAQIGPEVFFPDKGGSVNDAKKICDLCEVTDDCLEYAMTTNQREGVWGGLTVRERRKLRISRAAIKQAS